MSKKVAVQEAPSSVITVSDRPLFILAAPRSFTSIVCTMLGQHPQLYGLPETHPFVAEAVSERARVQAQVNFHINHGLLRVIAELFFGGQTAETVRLARGWLRRRESFSSGYLLEQFAAHVAPRILVEKSTSTVFIDGSLERAARMFPGARFLHLVRHPRAQCESLLAFRQRKVGHGLGSNRRGNTSHPDDASIGEKDPGGFWLSVNRKICRFLSSVPAQHQMWMRGEDLLAQPDERLRDIATWLDLRVDAYAIAKMKHPEGSPYACVGPPGARWGNDPLFLANPALRPFASMPEQLDAPTSWSKDGSGFSPPVQQLAREFGYE